MQSTNQDQQEADHDFSPPDYNDYAAKGYSLPESTTSGQQVETPEVLKIANLPVGKSGSERSSRKQLKKQQLLAKRLPYGKQQLSSGTNAFGQVAHQHPGAGVYSPPYHQDSPFMQAFVQSVQDEQFQQHRQILFVPLENKFQISGVNANPNPRQVHTALSQVQSRKTVQSQAQHARLQSAGNSSQMNIKMNQKGQEQQRTPQTKMSSQQPGYLSPNSNSRMSRTNPAARGSIMASGSQFSHQKTTSIPHHQRINQQATQKLNELLVFDEGSNFFKVKQIPGKTTKSTKWSQEIDSRFTNHQNKRTENLEKLGEIRARQGREQMEKKKQSYRLPVTVSRLEQSRLMPAARLRLLTQTQMDEPKNVYVSEGSRQQQLRPGSTDYSYDRTTILLNGAKARQSIHGSSLEPKQGDGKHEKTPMISRTQSNSDSDMIYNIKVDILNEKYPKISKKIANNLQPQLQRSAPVSTMAKKKKTINPYHPIDLREEYVKEFEGKDIEIAGVFGTDDNRWLEAQMGSSPVMSKTVSKISECSPKMRGSMQDRPAPVWSNKSSINNGLSGTQPNQSNEALEIAKHELNKSRRLTTSLGLNGCKNSHGRPSSLKKIHRESILQMTKEFEENHHAQISGLENRFFDDEMNYNPSTSYSVTLNFKKEFVRHKRIMCSIKEFATHDIQSKWDIGYCKTFCENGNISKLGKTQQNVAFIVRSNSARKALMVKPELSHPQRQTVGEQNVDNCSKHSHIESYQLDEEIKESVAQIINKEIGQTKSSQKSVFLAKEQTLFNTHTKQLIEGYLDPSKKNDANLGIADFSEKMVLRFKNEHEVSMYFEVVDQLTKVMVLKGHKVLLEKDHYQDILQNFTETCRDFMLFLCKDEAYGSIKAGLEDDSRSQEDQSTCKMIEGHSVSQMGPGEGGNGNQEVVHQQQGRFRKRDTEHRSFIRAFMFDYIFKTFITILDECLTQRDRLVAEQKDEWQYFSDKKCNYLDSECVAMQHQLDKMKLKHKQDCESYEARIEALKTEGQEYQRAIQEYKGEIHFLKDFDTRHDKVAELRRHVLETQDFMEQAESEMALQRKLILPVLSMVNVVAQDQKFVQSATQTDCQIGCYRANHFTQVDSNDLSQFASSNLQRLESVMQKLREKHELEKGPEEETDEEERFTRLLEARGSPNTKSPSSKKMKRKATRVKKQKSKIFSKGDPALEVLSDVQENPLSVKELSDQLNGYLSELTSSNFSFTSFDDFICAKLLSEKPSVIQASGQVDKILNCMSDEQNLDHPMVQLFQRVIGVNGHKRMDKGVFAFFKETRNHLIKEAGAGLHDSVTFSHAVDFIKKQFKNNPELVTKILGSLHEGFTRKNQEAAGLMNLLFAIKKNTFDFDKTWSEKKIARFFEKKNQEHENKYIDKLNFAFLSILAQVKANKVDLRNIFTNIKKGEDLPTLMKPTRSQIQIILETEGNVLMSEDEFDLIFSFIAPDEMEDSDLDCNLEPFMDLLEKGTAAIKQKVSQAVLHNLILDKCDEFIIHDISYSIEESVRSILKVKSVPVGTLDMENQDRQFSISRSPSKKLAERPVDLNYHTDYEQFKKAVEGVNAAAGVMSINQISGVEQLASSPNNKITSPRNDQAHLQSRRAGFHFANNDRTEEQYHAQFDVLSLFLKISTDSDFLKPLSKELGQNNSQYMVFGHNYTLQYGNDCSMAKYRDMIQKEFVVQSEGGKSNKKKKHRSTKTAAKRGTSLANPKAPEEPEAIVKQE